MFQSRQIIQYIIILLCSFFVIFPVQSRGAMVDRIVAVVNDEVITLSELEKKAEPIIKKVEDENQGSPLSPAQKQEILSRLLPQLIDEKLVEQEIKRLGITVTEQEIDGAIEKICRDNHITRETLIKSLEQQGISFDEYKKGLKDQIERSRLIQAQVRAKIVVTDEQIDAYIKEHPLKKKVEGPVYSLQHICVVPEDANDPDARERARRKAEKALMELKEGKSFEDTARRYSNVPSASEGGFLGTFTLKDMAPFVQNAIKGLKPGDYSNVIETPMGWQIFRVKGIVSGNEHQASDTYREEIRQKLFRQQINERFDEWLRQLRSQSTIRILL